VLKVEVAMLRAETQLVEMSKVYRFMLRNDSIGCEAKEYHLNKAVIFILLCFAKE